MQNHILDFSKNVLTKDVKSVYYLLSFLITLAASLTFATYVLFLLNNGLDLLQVMLVNLSFMVGNFIFEIPTGAYADYFGRRKSVILSCIFATISLFIYFMSSNIWFFILAELTAALSFTFFSGALDAWMVDSLEKKGSGEKVDSIFSQSNIISQSAVLIGGLAGGYIGTVNLALPFGVGAVSAFVALLVSIFFMHEERIIKKTLSIAEGVSQMTKVAKNSIIYGVKHKVVLWLIFSTILVQFAFMPLNMYWSPRLNELAGNQIWLMGWVLVGSSLFMMAGSFLVKNLLKRDKTYLWLLIFASLILGLPIIVIATSNIFGVVLLGFLTYQIGRGILDPVHKAYLNKYIPSEQRATILSFDSMMGKFGAALGLVILGWIAKNYSIQTSWFISGILLLFLIPIYMRARKHENLMKDKL
ncbi:MAG: MFS transporter [Candidatus Daviesbacteria bacterium]|nr:MFS transporter [Candidatus Daviesbacteria bacterium]